MLSRLVHDARWWLTMVNYVTHGWKLFMLLMFCNVVLIKVWWWSVVVNDWSVDGKMLSHGWWWRVMIEALWSLDGYWEVQPPWGLWIRGAWFGIVWWVFIAWMFHSCRIVGPKSRDLSNVYLKFYRYGMFEKPMTHIWSTYCVQIWLCTWSVGRARALNVEIQQKGPTTMVG